jgi:hypothetical protein
MVAKTPTEPSLKTVECKTSLASASPRASFTVHSGSSRPVELT